MYKAIQEQIQPRMLLILLVSLVLMAILASYLYVIKTPYLALQQKKQTLALLQNEVLTGVPLQNKIKMQKQLVEQLKIKLHGSGPKLPVNKMVAYVIGALDKIANQYHVKLTSVKPQKTNMLFTFKEMPFQIEISGDYFSLFSWLQGVEKELGPIVIKQFNIFPVGHETERKMLLTIVAYQFESNR